MKEENEFIVVLVPALAVRDFLYHRVAVIEPVEGGYCLYKVAPLVRGGLTNAEASVLAPYGEANAKWEIKDGQFATEVKVLVAWRCKLAMPSRRRTLYNGAHLLAWRYSDASDVDDRG